MTGDQASFRSFFKDIRGQRVAWGGRVVEVAKEFGDDYVEVNMLVVDLDSALGGSTDGDVRFAISAALAEEHVFRARGEVHRPDRGLRVACAAARAPARGAARRIAAAKRPEPGIVGTLLAGTAVAAYGARRRERSGSEGDMPCNGWMRATPGRGRA